jgi:hypothetical protein
LNEEKAAENQQEQNRSAVAIDQFHQCPSESLKDRVRVRPLQSGSTERAGIVVGGRLDGKQADCVS